MLRIPIISAVAALSATDLLLGQVTDLESATIRIGSVLMLMGTIIGSVWYLRGRWDRHERQHHTLEKGQKAIMQALDELPCRPPPQKINNPYCQLNGGKYEKPEQTGEWPVDEGSKS